MLVCHCTGTSDAQIRAAIRAGAADPREIGRTCSGAGQGCGTCRRSIDSLIADELALANDPDGGEEIDGVLLAAG
jgi:bacterioferritin-associated ferredoxin